jgi:hypothetical protein
MRISVSTGISKGFNTFLREAIKMGFQEIELVSEHVNDENLMTLDRLSKLTVSGLRGDIKNYKYFLYLAQSLGVDYLSFDISDKDKSKLKSIIHDAEKMGVTIAVENHSKEEGYPYTPEDMKGLTAMGARIVLDTAKAKTVVRDLSLFTKYLKEKIIAIRVSDFYGGFGHLPIGMGELVYLEPILKEFGKSKIQMVINLKENYNLIDAWISRENLMKYYKSVPKN